MLELLLVLLVGLLVTAVVYYIAQALGLPHPIPVIVALCCVVIVILIAAGSVDSTALR